MDTGEQWGYRTQITNLYYDTLWVYKSRDSIVQNSKVTVLTEGDSVLATGQLTKLMTETTVGQNTYTQLHWYMNTSSNLIRWAYTNGGATAYVFPKLKHSKYLTVNEYKRIKELFNSDIYTTKAINDTILKYESPQILLKYPVRTGDSWQMSYAPFGINRKVTGIEKISSALGTIDVYKLETTLSGLGLTYYDYISLDYGLVRRMWKDTLLQTGESDPVPIGYLIWQEESNLISK